MSFLCFRYETTFNINCDNNLLCCNNCIYKYTDSGDEICQVNVYGIRKKQSWKYLTMSKYQVMLVNKGLKDKLSERNTRLILLSNQAQRVAYIITLDNFCLSK